MTDATVPQDVLDGIAAELNAGSMMDTAPDVDDVPDVTDEAPDGEDTPDGFLDYEDYIAQGRDPEFYQGKKAFAEKQQLVSEKKELKAKFQKIDDDMLRLQQSHDREKQRLKAEIESKKQQAKADLDFDAYEQLDKQQRELDAPQQQGNEHQVVAGYRKEFPELNPGAPEFKQEYAQDFAALFNARAMAAAQRAGRGLTDSEIRQHLDSVRKQLGGQAATPQAERPSKAAPAKRTTAKKDPVDSLDPLAKDMYMRWKNHHDPKKRAYAETLLQNAQQGA